ncbi:hypothetical protein ACFSWE_03360 [Leucobacter albus]|uniref:Leucine rich repeat variant domain-containing protein n=1 Tax=Leucobacter albus TaxID=272210 RepID=A0ABW3TND1_9MICO
MTIEDLRHATALASDPATPPETLAHIAGAHRELWPAVSEHPNAYPELIAWMQQQAGGAAGDGAQPSPDARPRTRTRTRARKTWVIIGAAAAALVLGGAAVAISFFVRGDDSGVAGTLALVEGVAPGEEFCFSFVDSQQRLESGSGILDLGTGDVDMTLAPFYADCGDPFYGAKKLRWLEPDVRGTATLQHGMTGTVAIVGDVSAGQLTAQLGEPAAGVWRDADRGLAYSVTGDQVLVAMDGEDPPASPPAQSDSLASHATAAQLVAALGQGEPLLLTLGTSESLARQPLLQSAPVTGYATAVTEEGAVLTMSIAFAHKSAADASANLEHIRKVVGSAPETFGQLSVSAASDPSVAVVSYPVKSEGDTRVFWELLSK